MPAGEDSGLSADGDVSGEDGLGEVSDEDGSGDEDDSCDCAPVLGVHPTNARVATAAAATPTSVLPRVWVFLPNPLSISILPEHTEGTNRCKRASGGREEGAPTRRPPGPRGAASR